MKKYTACITALLLLTPLMPLSPFHASACAAASEQITLHDTEETVTLPAQEIRPGAERNRERSVRSPAAWLIAEDQCTTVYDESGRKVFYGGYPSLRLRGAADTPLTHALDAWNGEMRMRFLRSPVLAYSKEERLHGEELRHYYFETMPITQWGRVDDQMISFLMEGSTFAGGAHPLPRVFTATFDTASGRQIALEEIVTSREALLAAIAAAFHAAHADVEKILFPHDIMEELLVRHPAEEGLKSFRWYMAADGSLVIYYEQAEIAAYAAGAFPLTITRAAAPDLFIAADPMK